MLVALLFPFAARIALFGTIKACHANFPSSRTRWLALNLSGRPSPAPGNACKLGLELTLFGLEISLLLLAAWAWRAASGASWRSVLRAGRSRRARFSWVRRMPGFSVSRRRFLVFGNARALPITTATHRAFGLDQLGINACSIIRVAARPQVQCEKMSVISAPHLVPLQVNTDSGASR